MFSAQFSVSRPLSAHQYRRLKKTIRSSHDGACLPVISANDRQKGVCARRDVSDIPIASEEAGRSCTFESTERLDGIIHLVNFWDS